MALSCVERSTTRARAADRRRPAPSERDAGHTTSCSSASALVSM
ncbi:hypothetical protein ACFPM0_27920 [Pseudonocardia sulfidoxydans]